MVRLAHCSGGGNGQFKIAEVLEWLFFEGKLISRTATHCQNWGFMQQPTMAVNDCNIHKTPSLKRFNSMDLSKVSQTPWRI
jgi:hypothetical protein